MREFGLILFVFTIGLQIGPGFFASLRDQGLALNGLAAAIVVGGGLLTLIFAMLFGIAFGAAAGLFSGATTNTPALGAAQQAGLKADEALADTPALSYAVAYPLGVVGIMASIIIVRLVFGIGRRKGGGAIRRPAALGQRADRVAQPSCRERESRRVFGSTQFRLAKRRLPPLV